MQEGDIKPTNLSIARLPLSFGPQVGNSGGGEFSAICSMRISRLGVVTLSSGLQVELDEGGGEFSVACKTGSDQEGCQPQGLAATPTRTPAKTPAKTPANTPTSTPEAQPQAHQQTHQCQQQHQHQHCKDQHHQSEQRCNVAIS